MDGKPMSEVWLDRAIKALEKGDLESAEVRLIISKRHAPSEAADSTLKVVQERKKFQQPILIRLPEIRERKVDSQECIRIAKQAIEEENFDEAKKFLYLAENCCPNFYSKKLLHMLKDQLVEDYQKRRNAKKSYAETLIENARADFDAGDYDNAERLLLISINNVFPTKEAHSLLKEVHEAMEFERRATKAKKSEPGIFLKILNFLTCRMLEDFGFMRHDEEYEDNSASTQPETPDPGLTNSHNNSEQEYESRFEPGTTGWWQRARGQNFSDSEDSCTEEDLKVYKEYFIYYKEQHQKEVDRVLNSKDDYERLGVPRGASRSQIQTAFKRLALTLHPDKNNTPKAKEAFVVINDARKRLLTNAVKTTKKSSRGRRHRHWNQ